MSAKSSCPLKNAEKDVRFYTIVVCSYFVFCAMTLNVLITAWNVIIIERNEIVKGIISIVLLIIGMTFFTNANVPFFKALKETKKVIKLCKEKCCTKCEKYAIKVAN